jgi:membrane protease YdiL (CAAX protease family)
MDLDRRNPVKENDEGKEVRAEERGPKLGWKLFGLLMLAGVLASLATVPYAMSLSGGSAEIPVWVFIAGTVIQGIILTAIAAGLGLWLGAKVGLGAWDIRSLLAGENGAGRRIVRSLPLALLLGVVGAVVVQLIGWGFMTVSPGSVPGMEDVEMWAAWEGFLVAAGAGISEEIWLRLGAMGILAWLLARAAKLVGGGEPDGEAPAWAVWASMAGAALLFGAAHLPLATSLGDGLTFAYAANVISMNALLGLVFGWLYWKRGLIAAMAAHFSTNIVLKVVLVAAMPMFT